MGLDSVAMKTGIRNLIPSESQVADHQHSQRNLQTEPHKVSGASKVRLKDWPGRSTTTCGAVTLPTTTPVTAPPKTLPTETLPVIAPKMAPAAAPMAAS